MPILVVAVLLVGCMLQVLLRKLLLSHAQALSIPLLEGGIRS